MQIKVKTYYSCHDGKITKHYVIYFKSMGTLKSSRGLLISNILYRIIQSLRNGSKRVIACHDAFVLNNGLKVKRCYKGGMPIVLNNRLKVKRCYKGKGGGSPNMAQNGITYSV